MPELSSPSRQLTPNISLLLLTHCHLSLFNSFFHFIYFYLSLYYVLGFPGGSMVKNPPVMQATLVQSMGQEDPLKGGHGNPLQYS